MTRTETRYRKFDNHPCKTIMVACDDCGAVSESSRKSKGEFYTSHHANYESRKDGFREFRRRFSTHTQVINLCRSCQSAIKQQIKQDFERGES